MRRLLLLALLAATPALAGPPYLTDDPVPTELGHFETYAFTTGTDRRGDTGGEAGIEINYGAAKNLQLSIDLPLGYDAPRGGGATAGVADIGIGAKYLFLTQEDFGWDVSFYPSAEIPARSRAALGDGRPSYFLPVWAQKDWGDWSTFGGGGYNIHSGADARGYWFMGWALTRKLSDNLEIGAEIYHGTPDARDAKASTGLGAGAIWRLDDHYSLLASFGPGIQNAAETQRFEWYAALGYTF
ncbi:MAG TPA: transporter [Rhizomicrobium sp.]|nr:transporter [Rhizomicrobium sp.]